MSLMLGMTTTGLTGCTMLGGLQQKLSHSECVDDFMISHRNKVMAARAWLHVKHCHRNHAHSKDLQAGFLAGYREVAAGGSGCTPAVVSADYWGWRYQSGSGQAAMNAWFEGYPLGVKAAEQAGIGHYNMIRLNSMPHATSNMTGSAAPTPAVVESEHPSGSGALEISNLPAGIILGEGETLVPGQVSVQEMGFKATLPAPRSSTGHDDEMRGSRSDDPNAPPAPADANPARTPGQEPPASDPFSDEVGRRNQRLPSQVQFSDVEPGAAKSRQSTSASGDPSMELVPKISATVAVQQADIPNSLEGQAGEPTQAEIDAVIEEIFGKPSPRSPQ